MKQFMQQIIANDSLRQRLCSDILNDRLSHAYIIEGVKGSGKHTIARAAAAALSCENKGNDRMPLPCGECRSCKKILGSISPDVITVGCGDRVTMGVDSIRFLREDIYVIPNDLDYKVYIIEDADKMTEQAQNAFLLSLEEPPSYVLFLLLCEDSGAFLETIRSRAPVLRTEPVSKEQIDDYICRVDRRAAQMKISEPHKYEELLMSAGNGIGQALELLEPKSFAPVLERRKLVKDFVSCALDNSSREQAVALMRAFSTKREALSQELELIYSALRDILAVKKSDTVELCFYESMDTALELSERVSATRLVKLCDAVFEICERVEKNANVRLTLLSLLSNLEMI